MVDYSGGSVLSKALEGIFLVLAPKAVALPRRRFQLIRTHPRQPFLRRIQRVVLTSDPAFVADGIEKAKQVVEVDLAGSGLIASRDICDLDVADAGKICADGL